MTTLLLPIAAAALMSGEACASPAAFNQTPVNGNLTLSATTTNRTGYYYSVTASNLTIGGILTNNFSGEVSAIVNDIISKANADKSLLATYMSSYVSNRVSSSFPTSKINALPVVRSDPRSWSSGDYVNLNDRKLITFTSSGNGLDLVGVHFDNIDADYTYTNVISKKDAGGVTNGLIGNNYQNSAAISMGDIIGNAFTNIPTKNTARWRAIHQHKPWGLG